MIPRSLVIPLTVHVIQSELPSSPFPNPWTLSSGERLFYPIGAKIFPQDSGGDNHYTSFLMGTGNVPCLPSDS